MSDGEDRWVGPGHWEWVPNENKRPRRRSKRKVPAESDEPSPPSVEPGGQDADQQEAPRS